MYNSMSELQTIIQQTMEGSVLAAVGEGSVYNGDQYRLTKQIVTLAYALHVGTDGADWETPFKESVQAIFTFADATVADLLVQFVNDNYADFMNAARAEFLLSIQSEAETVVKNDIIAELSE
jgi:hypothetical protein